MFTLRDETDTVVALATARAPGARAVLRVVGPDALPVAGAVFEAAAPAALARAPGSSTLAGQIRTGGVQVPAAAWVFRAPRSYTGEDAVELHVPSCLPLLERLEEALVAVGARPARLGELTRRAFLAGKLDLAQAEAVQALCQAETDDAALAALRQLRGGLSAEVAELRAALLGALTQTEGALDFADEGIEQDLVREAGVAERLAQAVRRLDALLTREADQAADRARPRVLLFGPKNAGKSSLFNALVGRDAALVSDVAGTTRDDVREVVTLAGGREVELVDLAGVGGAGHGADAPADVEAKARALGELPRAEVVVCVLDGAAPLDAAGARTVALVGALRRPVVWVAQKADLPARLQVTAAPGSDRSPPLSPIPVSARTGVGLAALRARLAAALESRAATRAPAGFAPNPRHRACLLTARGFAERARAALEAGLAGELVAIDLRDALDAIGEIVGLGTTPEDLLDRIFETFCIGK